MPEGDTILRAARVLSRALEGRKVERFASQLTNDTDVAGQTVSKVEAVGKYLLVRFAPSGRVLVTHMKMTGSWHIYKVGERWRRGASHARAVIETDAYIAVCFDAPVVRLESAKKAQRDLAQLGPDILSPAWDAGAAIARIRAEPHLTIGEALLAQRLVAGIGNVYKSEALFCAKLDPRAKVSQLTDDDLARVLGEAHRLMRANLGPGRRRTRGGRSPYWVYDREAAPCLRCTTPLERIYQGLLGAHRATWFCPKCQGNP